MFSSLVKKTRGVEKSTRTIFTSLMKSSTPLISTFSILFLTKHDFNKSSDDPLTNLHMPMDSKEKFMQEIQMNSRLKDSWYKLFYKVSKKDKDNNQIIYDKLKSFPNEIIYHLADILHIDFTIKDLELKLHESINVEQKHTNVRNEKEKLRLNSKL